MKSLRIVCLVFLALVSMPGFSREVETGGAEIRRTADGIPHIRAAGWRGLGYGYGYVQAEDALCTLAEAFVTFEGRRSYFFGSESRPRADSTFGRPLNIELDFFFRSLVDAEMLAEYRRQQPAELIDLIEGFADGYSRYLLDARRSAGGNAKSNAQKDRACLREPWVRTITADDIFRRMAAINLAAGYAKFIPEIVNANAGAAQRSALLSSDTDRMSETMKAKPAGNDGVSTSIDTSLRRKLAANIGAHPGLGSNMIAFGRQATGAASAVLVGNPHWYWSGPDRFYQAHLTIPGRLNVAGVSLLGVPVIMIGFNDKVAWSHTVSEARRFGIFELALDAGSPTVYRHGDETEPMRPVSVAVETRGSDGEMITVSRTLYRTRFGPVIDLGAHDEAFRWSGERAFAIRDINAENFRIFRTFFYWSQAASLDEFVAIQRREAAIPWANTVAIARGDGRVWYGDVGAVPNAPDSLRENCTTDLGKAFAQMDARAPFLDGSRKECGWLIDERAAQPGAMPADRQPWLFREDYVANMNDSYWLSSARQPLEGYPRILGEEREPLSLRGRLGHRLAQDALAAAPMAAPTLSQRLREQALDARVYSAELFKTGALDRICRLGDIEVTEDILTEQKFAPSRRVDLLPACNVLREWKNKGNADDRGAHLWDAFWARVERISPAELFRVPFSPDSPLNTPAQLNMDDPRIAQALGAAVLAVAANGLALDAPRGAYLGVQVGRDRVPLYGGCHDAGYFVVACNDNGGYGVDGSFFGNSYLQVVSFGVEGVEAYTLLAHGQDESGIDGGKRNDALRRYAAKQWLRFPFTDAQVKKESRRTVTLRSR